MQKGFTLIELLIVITIISILSLVLQNVINPVEINRQTRDAVRLADLAQIQQSINVYSNDKTVGIFCFENSPCSGSSFPFSISSQASSGQGWIKINFSNEESVILPYLPIDPINSANYNYVYYSDGKKWEINAALESAKYQIKMSFDGGDNPQKYEVGSSLKLIN